MRTERSDVRLSARPDVDTVGVGLRRDDHDDALLDRAMVVAAEHHARLVIVAPYEPVGARELACAQRDAPPDVHCEITSIWEVETFLECRAHRAARRGLAVTTVAVPGHGDRAIVRAARAHDVDLLVGVAVRTPRTRGEGPRFRVPSRRAGRRVVDADADAPKVPVGTV